ncbi:NAD-dependent succinate-semialdehyde dehydrogenase [Endozoicomonas sp. G2_2]|uniref:NAD-dependent succinate-semialdehyde dehydrogenase n=1 Tax=Gammaproteobacteria TaxID=1236 RepID=UPI000C6833DC|nr:MULTISPECIES: NAD-dependent succinate-semialdehyde dehydrogenase [Gammaproteobacteria]MAS09208.1 succinate-semialdehyde dehydrogenase [Salinisphaera sp.]MBO9468697.1 NAD-dependent succinate-semialdehyde dehydrogenase [Endozoicomonas sp. G2_2]
MAQTQQTINPANGEVIATYELASDEQALQTLRDSHEAFLKWRTTTLEERGGILREIAKRLRAGKDDYAALMTREMGKPISQGGDEIELCAAICEYTADTAADELGDEERALDGGRALISYQPQGVILGIQPWNFPFYQVIRYSIANIMAGNTVLLKHAPNVWGAALEIEKVFREAGLPENVFRTLLIDAEQTGQLIAHEYVRGVTLTGSPKAGAAVAAKAGQHLKKSVLELGSNDAYLVLDDADIDRAVETCAQGRIYNNGETCVAAKRFIVVDSVYESFRDKFVERMRQVEYGDPTDPNTVLGPIAREDLRDTLHDLVTRSIDAGATCVFGGELPEGPGYFYPATVLEDLAPGMPAYDEELFGPVASLIRVADEDEAIRVANDSRYGLGGGIFSKDEKRAIDIARNLFDTGMVNINGYRLAQPHLPFGGVKDSGYGREHGGFGMKEFVNAKAVMIVD